MILTTFASGSSGNCALVSHEDTYILVDAGISCRRITQMLAQLELTPEDLTAVLITHEHSDHISGLATLVKKYHPPVWCSTGTGRRLEQRIVFDAQTLHTVQSGLPISLGGLTVNPFSTLHDAAESVGYTFTDGRCKAAFVTDLGIVTSVVRDAVQGADLLIAEANHDPELVEKGPYPYLLKQRILGHYGHLSNQACAQLAAQAGAQTVVLAHLSAENNDPVLARQEVCAAVAPGVTVDVAPRNEMSRRYELL